MASDSPVLSDQTSRTIVHGRLQRIRGMITDEDSWEQIENALATAVDVAKDVEAERDRLHGERDRLQAMFTAGAADYERLRAGVSYVRGMCSDGEPLELIDAKLGEILNGD